MRDSNKPHLLLSVGRGGGRLHNLIPPLAWLAGPRKGFVQATSRKLSTNLFGMYFLTTTS